MSHDKYSNYTHHNYSASTTTTSPYRKRYSEKEIDPYAPTIVEELLQVTQSFFLLLPTSLNHS